jgi:hypothetical protein
MIGVDGRLNRGVECEVKLIVTIEENGRTQATSCPGGQDRVVSQVLDESIFTSVERETQSGLRSRYQSQVWVALARS